LTNSMQVDDGWMSTSAREPTPRGRGRGGRGPSRGAASRGQGRGRGKASVSGFILKKILPVENS